MNPPITLFLIDDHTLLRRGLVALLSQYDDLRVVGETHETGTLDRRVDIQHAGEVRRLIGDDTDGDAVVAGKANDQIGRKLLFGLEELTVVDCFQNDLLHVVGHVSAVRHEGIQRSG